MSARHGLDTTRADLMPPTTLSLNTPPSAPQIRVSPSDNVRLTNLRIVLYCIVLYCTPSITQFNFQSVVLHRDGKLLIGGGRSRYLHIWSLDTQSLLRVVELPRKVTSVHQLEFLPSSFDAGSNKVCHLLSCMSDILVALQTAVVCLFM